MQEFLSGFTKVFMDSSPTCHLADSKSLPNR